MSSLGNTLRQLILRGWMRMCLCGSWWAGQLLGATIPVESYRIQITPIRSCPIVVVIPAIRFRSLDSTGSQQLSTEFFRTPQNLMTELLVMGWCHTHTLINLDLFVTLYLSLSHFPF